MNICIADGCSKESINKYKPAYCKMHYNRIIRHGSENPKIRVVDPDRTCVVDNCNERHEAQGFCNKHYKKNRSGTRCILKGCNHVISSRDSGLCEIHAKLLRLGADLDTMISIYETFDGKCAICKSPDPKGYYRKFHTDHDHITGKVRGLLCDNCNKGLGHFKDNIHYLESAVRYLSESKQEG